MGLKSTPQMPPPVDTSITDKTAEAEAKLEAERQTKLQDITDPYQRLSFVSDIQRGAPSTQTTVAQGFAPTASPFAQAVGTGIGAYAALAPK